MKLQRIETPGIAHYAWLVAGGADAALLDPRRDIDEYLAAARALGVRIRYVVETHRQEDFVMGSAAVAAATGAEIVTGEHFGHGDRRLSDGEALPVGGVVLRALHTPGHTPESMSYAVYEHGGAKEPWGVFTGDALFYGSTGRTDLAGQDQCAENAALLYDSVHEKLASLSDSALVLPAHGPGSVCGSGIAERPWSTLGMEKQHNEVFTLGREEFVMKKAAERLPRPPYFRHMERVNLTGGMQPARHRGNVPLLDPETFAAQCNDTWLYDTREPEAFAGGHVPNSYAIWLDGLPVFGGWIGNERSRICLVTDRDEDVHAAAQHLSRIGIDDVQGALAGGFGSWRKSGLPVESSGVITPRELMMQRDAFQVLDVRESGEYEAGHIAGARHLYVGYLRECLEQLELDREAPVAVACSVGHRAGLGVSVLLRDGFPDVRNLLGGMTAWEALGLPTER